MSVNIPIKQSSNYFSPLRYPGGKSALSYFLGRVINENHLNNTTYVEPYAGGAGAALELLFLEKVKAIHINDFDPAIYAFWHAILHDTEKFIRKLKRTPISLEEWNKQRDIYARTKSLFKLGFATFYLNRSNRSGIITGGPVGGMNQTGKYKIDARFKKDKLIERIKRISNYRNRITVTNEDGISLMERLGNKGYFYYIDPPYYVKGQGLYLNAYQQKNHEELSRYLNKRRKNKWILTYDNVKEIQDLYSKLRSEDFSLNYFAGTVKKGKEIMVFSDKIIVPPSFDDEQLELF